MRRLHIVGIISSILIVLGVTGCLSSSVEEGTNPVSQPTAVAVTAPSEPTATPTLEPTATPTLEPTPTHAAPHADGHAAPDTGGLPHKHHTTTAPHISGVHRSGRKYRWRWGVLAPHAQHD